MWVFVPCGVLVPIVIICIVCHIFFTVGPVVATVLFWVALIAGCAIIIGIAALVMYFFQDFGGIASFISIVFFIGVSTGTIYGAWYIDLRLHHKDKYTLMQENKNTPKEEERRTIPVELVYIGTIVGTYQPYHRVETKFNGIYYKLKNDPLLKGDTAFTLAKYSHENFPTFTTRQKSTFSELTNMQATSFRFSTDQEAAVYQVKPMSPINHSIGGDPHIIF